MNKCFLFGFLCLISVSAIAENVHKWTWLESENVLTNDNGWAFHTQGTPEELVITGVKARPETQQDADFRTVFADTKCTLVSIKSSLFAHSAVIGSIGIPACTTNLPVQFLAWSYCTNFIVDPEWRGEEIPTQMTAGAKKNAYTEFPLHEGLKKIGSQAFGGVYYEGNANKILVIPASVEEIGGSAFSGCNYTSVVFAAGSKLKRIESATFAHNAGHVGKIEFPASVEYIGYQAFGWARNLGEIVFPEDSNLKEIDSQAFTYVDSVKKPLILPSKLEIIGDQAFSGANITGKLVIPASVRRIGNSAFNSNGGMTEVIFMEGCTNIGSSVFTRATSVTNIVFPKSLQYVGGGAMFGNDGWSNMRKGNIYWQSCPEFGMSTNLFYMCNRINNKESDEMTITNHLCTAKWIKFAEDYTENYGYTFEIPEKRKQVGVWFSGKNEAVVASWILPTLITIR